MPMRPTTRRHARSCAPCFEEQIAWAVDERADFLIGERVKSDPLATFVVATHSPPNCDVRGSDVVLRQGSGPQPVHRRRVGRVADCRRFWRGKLLKCRGILWRRKSRRFTRASWWWTQSHETSLPRLISLLAGKFSDFGLL